MYAIDDSSTISFEVWKVTDEQDNLFYLLSNEFDKNIAEIIDHYFTKNRLNSFYILEPHRELKGYIDSLPKNLADPPIKTERSDILSKENNIRVKATAHQLQIVRKYLTKMCVDTDDNVVKYYWAQLTKNFTFDILTKIYALNLNENSTNAQFETNDASYHCYVVSVIDILSNRQSSYQITNRDGFQYSDIYKQMTKTAKMIMDYMKTMRNQTLRFILHVYYDVGIEDLIKIDLFDLYHGKQSDSYSRLWKDLQNRMSQFISLYFNELDMERLILDNVYVPVPK